MDLQLEFLKGRFENEITGLKTKERVLILDRCIYEDFHIFARSQHELGIMNQKEFDEYIKVYQDYIKEIKEPDYFVYLKTSTKNSLERILKRGRDYERSISATYLDTLGRYYEEFFNSNDWMFKNTELIVIETDSLNSD